MSRFRPSRLARTLVVAIASLGVATLVVAYLQDVAGIPNPSAVYIIAVVATAIVGGALGAVATSVAAFLLYNFLFTAPRFTFSIADPAVWLSVLLLLFVGIVVGQLAALGRARADIAQAHEREALALFRVSRGLAIRDSTIAVLPEIGGILRDEVGLERVWISLGTDDAAERIAADTAANAATGVPFVPPAAVGLLWVLRRTPGDAPADWVRVHQTTRSPSSLDTYRVRIEAGGTALGSIWATRARERGVPNRPATRLLAAAADQVGQAIAQDRLAGASRAAEVARQSDALKSSLLQSVSHDLRTPLAAIRMAAASLRPDSGLDQPARRASADTIDREVEHLNRLVTNLLDVSRIEAGSLRVEREPMSLDDVLARAIERLRPRLGGHPIEVELEAPPVDVDPVLLDTAFVNVAENAIAHSDPAAPLRIRAAAGVDGFVRLTVEDGGPGVPPDALPHLFDKFYRVTPPGARAERSGPRAGTGIGLAVTRGFVEAMGGRVAARPSELGGLAIDLDLPAAAVPPGLA